MSVRTRFMSIRTRLMSVRTRCMYVSTHSDLHLSDICTLAINSIYRVAFQAVLQSYIMCIDRAELQNNYKLTFWLFSVHIGSLACCYNSINRSFSINYPLSVTFVDNADTVKAISDRAECLEAVY